MKDRREYLRQYSHSHLEQRREYLKRHREYFREYIRQYKERIKMEVLSHYSNGKPLCNVCNESRIDCLSIDHINGNGSQHRKALHLKGGLNFYGWIRKQNYPSDYQVLCMNCQYIKRAKNNEYG